MDPLSTSAVAVAAVVETEPVAVVCGGETLADACAETGPTVAVAEAETVDGSVSVVAVAEADAAGVLAPTVAVVADEPVDGCVCVVAVADADAAGVLTSTVALAAGAGAALTDAVTEALGVVGAPGSPSACAGSA